MSEPSLFLDPAFDAWLDVVESRLVAVFGLRLEDLPALPLRAAYDAGVRPHLCFFETVVPAVRSLLGSATDELLETDEPEPLTERP